MIAQPARRNTAFAMIFMVLVACGSQPTAVRTEYGKSVGAQAAAIALDQVGAPYRYGGNSPTGFDCSGLVQYSFLQAGVSTPRTTGQLWSAAQPVSNTDLRKGDLLFFRIDGKMSHVGMYVGGRRFVHAPQSGRSVSVVSLDVPYYRHAFIGAGRIY
ncbi:MAG TPA: C40 family peptidase [Woeseiaceae bacterium]|jgi:cell wall-associated NlpC family hydrolase|nr:C40 family peptidase [Woeseiaceae bacterium]